MTKLLTTIISYALFCMPFTGLFLCFYALFSAEVIYALVGQALIIGSLGLIWVMFYFVRQIERRNNNLYSMSDYLRKSKKL